MADAAGVRGDDEPGEIIWLGRLEAAKAVSRFDIVYLVGAELAALIKTGVMDFCTLHALAIAVALQVLEHDHAAVVELKTLSCFVKMT